MLCETKPQLGPYALLFAGKVQADRRVEFERYVMPRYRPKLDAYQAQLDRSHSKNDELEQRLRSAECRIRELEGDTSGLFDFAEVEYDEDSYSTGVIRLVEERAKAYRMLLVIETWMPRSQTTYLPEARRVHMTRWLAEQKGFIKGR